MFDTEFVFFDIGLFDKYDDFLINLPLINSIVPDELEENPLPAEILNGAMQALNYDLVARLINDWFTIPGPNYFAIKGYGLKLKEYNKEMAILNSLLNIDIRGKTAERIAREKEERDNKKRGLIDDLNRSREGLNKVLSLEGRRTIWDNIYRGAIVSDDVSFLIDSLLGKLNRRDIHIPTHINDINNEELSEGDLDRILNTYSHPIIRTAWDEGSMNILRYMKEKGFDITPINLYGLFLTYSMKEIREMVDLIGEDWFDVIPYYIDEAIIHSDIEVIDYLLDHMDSGMFDPTDYILVAVGTANIPMRVVSYLLERFKGLEGEGLAIQWDKILNNVNVKNYTVWRSYFNNKFQEVLDEEEPEKLFLRSIESNDQALALASLERGADWSSVSHQAIDNKDIGLAISILEMIDKLKRTEENPPPWF